MSAKHLTLLVLGTIVAVSVFGSAGFVSSRLQSAPPVDIETLAKQFCVSLPTAVHVLPGDRIDHSFDVDVPFAPGPLGDSSHSALPVAKGAVVRLVIRSPHPGAIGVHGLSDIVPIRTGERVQISFRAIYSGRFPVHFHGVDGSHYEVSAFEVL